jgi:Kef-type K+ transport system membrane component KefB/Trk K+ transport system NAD-binding subunit
MEESLSFVPLLLVVFLAFIVPILLSRFKRLRLPIVVGEILVGILVGRSGLGWVQHHDPALDLLSEFGFVFLMFLAGMEIDFSSLGINQPKEESANPRRLGPIQLGGLNFAITLIISSSIGFALYRLGYVRDIWMMALVLSTTSLGVVVPVLKERQLSSGLYGQSLLIAALIADFATMILITVDVAILSHGLTLDILLIGVLFVAFFFMARYGDIFFNRVPVVRDILEDLSHATAQIKVRLAFSMMLTFVVLAEVLGAEVILGAFLAGAIVSLLRRPEDDELVHQLESIGFGFFIPIFFIMVGVDFNLVALLASPQAIYLIPILLVAAFLVKFLPALVFRLRFSWRETMGAGALLSSRLSLIIAASAIGLRLGVISEPVNADIILVAIITVTISPLIFLRIMPAQPEHQRRPIIVVGSGSLGLHVAEQIAGHKEWVIVLDEREDRIKRARQMGFEAFVACVDCQDEGIIPYMNNAKSLVCVYSDVERNYQVCYQARTTYGIDHVVTRIDVPGEIPRFDKLGVTAMNAAVDQASLLSILVRNPDAYELLTRTSDDKEVREVIVRSPAFFGTKLKDVDLPGDLLIMALRRDGQLMVPKGEMVFNAGDHLTVVGSVECVEKSREMFSGYVR